MYSDCVVSISTEHLLVQPRPQGLAYVEIQDPGDEFAAVYISM